MELNYICTDIFVAERLESCRRDAGEFRQGTASPIVAIIGQGAVLLGRGATAIARWADGTSELNAGARRSALIR